MEQLGIDYKLLLAQLINFLLLFYLYKKFLAKPFSSFIKQQKYKEKLQEEYEQKLADLQQEKERILQSAKKQAQQEAETIIKAAERSAEELKKRLMAEVKQEVDRERRKQLAELENEKALFEKELKQKVLDIALKLTEQTLKEFMTEERKKEYQKLLINNLQKIN